MQKGTKIQIGASARSQGSNESSNTSKLSEINGERPSTATLFELCDSHFMSKCRKGRKRAQADSTGTAKNKKKNDDRVPPDFAAAAAPHANEVRSGPQVEIIDGKITLRESSLIVGHDEGITAEGEYEEVEEGVHATATYSSFLKRKYSVTWGIEETRRFYMVLRQCGTDFSMMQSFFPRRTRKQLKKKFYREEHQHPELVKRSLDTQLPLDMSVFEVHLGPISDKPNELDGTTEDFGEEEETELDKQERENSILAQHMKENLEELLSGERTVHIEGSARELVIPDEVFV